MSNETTRTFKKSQDGDLTIVSTEVATTTIDYATIVAQIATIDREITVLQNRRAEYVAIKQEAEKLKINGYSE